VTTAPTHDPIQQRVVRTLAGTQVLGGVGLSAGVAVGALLAEDVSGSAQFAGLGGTFQVLGAALIAIPMSRVMAAHAAADRVWCSVTCWPRPARSASSQPG
jgi:hypothetical protein